MTSTHRAITTIMGAYCVFMIVVFLAYFWQRERCMSDCLPHHNAVECRQACD